MLYLLVEKITLWKIFVWSSRKPHPKHTSYLRLNFVINTTALAKVNWKALLPKKFDISMSGWAIITLFMHYTEFNDESIKFYIYPTNVNASM